MSERVSQMDRDGWCSCASDRHRFVYIRWDALGPDKPPCPLCDLLDARERIKDLEGARMSEEWMSTASVELALRDLADHPTGVLTGVGQECVMRDLLDARRERDEARKLIEAWRPTVAAATRLETSSGPEAFGGACNKVEQQAELMRDWARLAADITAPPSVCYPQGEYEAALAAAYAAGGGEDE